MNTVKMVVYGENFVGKFFEGFPMPCPALYVNLCLSKNRHVLDSRNFHCNPFLEAIEPGRTSPILQKGSVSVEGGSCFIL